MRRLLAFVGMLLVAMESAIAGAASQDPVEAALDNITALTRPREVGYATVWDGNKFVQCRRWQGGTMRCEAAGSLMQPSLKQVLTVERKAFLDGEGWVVDPSFGLFVKVFPADLSVADISSRIRAALVQGYDGSPAHFEVRTRWIKDVKCPPRIGPTQSLAGVVDDSPAMKDVTLVQCSYVPEEEDTPSRSISSQDELVRIYGPRVTAEIQRLRINTRSQVWVVVQAGIGYVQCAPETDPLAIYCEAQSAESWPALSTILTAERVSWLHAAGYSDPGRAPNYWKLYPLDGATDGAIAREILDVLFQVYGYRGSPGLEFKVK